MGKVTFWKTAHPYVYIEDEGSDYADSVRLDEGNLIEPLKYVNKYLPDIMEKALGDR